MIFDKVYQYNFPTIIRFGPGASNELGDYLIKRLGGKKITEQLVDQVEDISEDR